MALYFQYLNARFSDRKFQVTLRMINDLINIPGQIAFEIQTKGK